MIIGLAGYARVGKNTMASMIMSEPDTSVKMYQGAFADKLKEEVGKMLESVKIPKNVLFNEKEYYRDLMVFWGKNRRRLNPTYWIDVIINKYRALKEKLKRKDFLFIVTDVRYMNEVEAIIKEEGKVYIVQREGFGPANEEEKRSLAEVYAFAKENPDRVVILKAADALDVLQENSVEVFDDVYQLMGRG